VTVLVVGADEKVVAQTLATLGEEDSLIVLDPSAGALEALEHGVRDSRVWYQIGDGEVVPLPDGSVDAVRGEPGEDVQRVLR
jgi:hypothetical protein